MALPEFPHFFVERIIITKEIVRKEKSIAKKYGYTNVEFRLGDIEGLPVETGTIDVIISNCVINLALNKSKVFKEVSHVLKRGKMILSDIVLLKELEEKQKKDEELLSGCVAGALLKDKYLARATHDKYETRVADTMEEAQKLVEVSFEYQIEVEGHKLLRRKKTYNGLSW